MAVDQMSTHTAGFLTLPNEVKIRPFARCTTPIKLIRSIQILCLVLNSFPTRSLLQYAVVCHRFRGLIDQIVHNRLLKAASLKDHKLILECYHPTAQYTEPYLLCEYLGTPGLNDSGGKEGSTHDRVPGTAELGKLYSRFLPRGKDAESEPRIVRSHPAGDVPGSRTSPTPGTSSSGQTVQPDMITRTVSMEPHELFSQLCVSASLVQVGPRRGVFLSCVDVLKKTTTRIFRDWLAGRAGASKNSDPDGYELVPNSTTKELGSSHEQHRRLIWVDQENNVGLGVRAHERKWRRNTPILVHQDEDQAISYSLELAEVLVRTTHLLLTVEKSILDTESHSGKAMIFGSFATRNDDQE